MTAKCFEYNFLVANNRLSRRDFLKLGGLGLAGLAFDPPKQGGISFDDAEVVRVATNSWSVYSQPSLDSSITSTWYRDDLLHIYKEITAPPPTPAPDQTPTPNPNPVWYRVWGGYAWRSRLQRVRSILNTPLDTIPADSLIPAGTGMLAEVTVPWSSPWRFSKADGWLQLEEPTWRLYYGSVHWIDSVQSGPPTSPFTGPWYRIWDHVASFPYYAPALHFRPIAADEYAPISPDVPWDSKRIDVNLTRQTLAAYEGDKLVFKTTVSTGIPSAKTNTHTGKFSIMEKLPSELMGTARFSQTVDGYYQLPGVPWTCYFTEDGQAFHGTYWHDNFGTPMSHGCVNMRTSEALWLFRWATPAHAAGAYVNNQGHGTPVDVHF